MEGCRDAESFYATGAGIDPLDEALFAPDRSFGRESWGDESYAPEDLVAELASAFLCANLGMTPEVRDDHASNIASCLTVLKNDKRAIFNVAAHAQKAVDFLHGPQETEGHRTA
jgi:antirestriction protein ArdC